MKREWLVFQEEADVDWLGNPAFRTMLLTHVEGSDKYHWSGRPQWTSFNDNWKIVKSYGWFERGSEFEENILDAFQREYRMPVPYDPENLFDKSAPEGWVAPDGSFYPVHYGGHTPEAEDICQLILKLDEYNHGYAELHKRGWVSIHQGFILTDGHDIEYDLPVLLTLKALRKNATVDNYIEHMDETMKRVEDHVKVLGVVS